MRESTYDNLWLARVRAMRLLSVSQEFTQCHLKRVISDKMTFPSRCAASRDDKSGSYEALRRVTIDLYTREMKITGGPILPRVNSMTRDDSRRAKCDIDNEGQSNGDMIDV